MKPTTEFNYPKYVVVSWAHTCGHLSPPLFYASTAFSEADRQCMEGQWCWECRNRSAVRQAKTKYCWDWCNMGREDERCR